MNKGTLWKALFKVSEIRLLYRNKVPVSKAPQIGCSRDAYNVLKEMWDDDIGVRESMYMLLLNRSNKVKGCVLLTKGGISYTPFDGKIAFAIALRSLSSAIMIAHNHPSGTLNVSQADIEMTRKVAESCKILDITFLDHLILTPDGRYKSMADEGLI